MDRLDREFFPKEIGRQSRVAKPPDTFCGYGLTPGIFSRSVPVSRFQSFGLSVLSSGKGKPQSHLIFCHGCPAPGRTSNLHDKNA